MYWRDFEGFGAKLPLLPLFISDSRVLSDLEETLLDPQILPQSLKVVLMCWWGLGCVSLV